MITKLSKVLVVFVTFASVAFVGFALAITNSGPNWVTASQALPDYEFTYTGGEKPSWAVKPRSGGDQTKSARAHPDVIGWAYDDAKKKLEEEIGKVSPQIKPLEDQIQATSQMIEQDLYGLTAKREQLSKQLDDIHKQIASITQETTRANEETLKIRGQAEQRRSDVYRLIRNYQAIEADQYQLVQQKRRLLDMLYQMQGLRNRLEERADDLLAQGAVATE